MSLPATSTSLACHPGRVRVRRWRLPVVALVAVLLSGCVAGFLYNRLDRLVAWYVGGYVTLDDGQQRQLRSLVLSTVAWHRVNQLPQYLEMLGQLERDIDKPMSPGLVGQRYAEMAASMDALLDHVIPETALLARSLRPTQIRELFDNLEEDNKDKWEEYGGRTRDARTARRVRTAVRTIQRFTGGLSSAQRAQVEAAAANMHDLSPQWLEHRRAWQTRFRSLLEGGAQGKVFEGSLRDLVVNPNRFDPPAYRDDVEENLQVVFRMLSDLSGSLTPKQRRNFADKMREYAVTVEEIARQQTGV